MLSSQDIMRIADYIKIIRGYGGVTEAAKVGKTLLWNP